MMRVPFVDLRKRHLPLRRAYNRALSDVLKRGSFILDSEVRMFERKLSVLMGSAGAVGVDNGTNAIRLALQGLGIGPGSRVAVPSLTAFPTAVAAMQTGATLEYVDVDQDSLLMTRATVERGLVDAPDCIVPVHLYGNVVEVADLARIDRGGIRIVEDCAQAFGAMIDSRPVGTIGSAGALSFYPTKNLGALGDAGAVITRSKRIEKRVRQLREYGKTSDGAFGIAGGINARLDELQAGFLRVQLSAYQQWNVMRRRNAAIYDEVIGAASTKIKWSEGAVYHQYVVRAKKRNLLRKYLKKRGVATKIHYPVPCHRQLASKHSPTGSLSQADRAANEVVSLPVAPELSERQITYAANQVNSYFLRGGS